jgi:hypothetical protein
LAEPIPSPAAPWQLAQAFAQIGGDGIGAFAATGGGMAA